MNLLLALLLLPFGGVYSEILIEAEDAEAFGVEVATEREGFSGAGYVTGFDEQGDSLRFAFDVEGGVYALWARIALGGRASQTTFRLDGESMQRTIFGTGGVFDERYLGEYWLGAGTHSVVLQGPFDVDYLRIELVVYEGPPRPSDNLVDPQATASARDLHRFLLNAYGEYILSGQQNLNEIQYIRNVTGKEVVVGGFDLMEYSPSRIEHGASPGRAVESWIDWASSDGIVALMWHWNAPTDLRNVPGSEWWRGFYTSATTFDLAAALADTTSERYALLLRDIDAIAIQLRKFADADVPLLWRPLHEAAGGWFWWGAKGAAPFVQLWRLMYHRLVDLHDLHNLIWVYTHEPGAIQWYPGHEYVDIVGRDVYASSHQVLMKSDWEELQSFYGERKLVALSESGTLPDPDVITDYGIWWSWFSLWNGNFIRDVDHDYLRRVLESERVLTRDELPAWRTSSSAIPPEAVSKATSLVLYPNPSDGATTVRTTLAVSADVRVEVFDAAGRLVRFYEAGPRPAGIFETQVALGDAVGVYFVRLLAGRSALHRTVVRVR